MNDIAFSAVMLALCAAAGVAAGADPPAPKTIDLIAELKQSGLISDPAPPPRPLIGEGLNGWRRKTGEWMNVGAANVDPANERHIATAPGSGVLVNGTTGRTVDLFTEADFGDIAAHIEFMIPKGSNSGVYFMGRYEVQVFDSFGAAKGKYPGIECGGIYPRWINNKETEGHSPLVNASLPPGQWQTFDVIFLAPRFDAQGRKTANARFLKVWHNGHLVHENIEVTGPTRAAAFNDEKPVGPLMFQGDHGPVAYRNLRVWELKRP